MASAPIEPGLLSLFRWYVGIRLGFLFVVLLGVRSDDPPDPAQAPYVGIVLFGTLMIFLVIPWFQRIFGRAFLPIAIIIATIAPIADAVATISHRLALGYLPNDALSDYWIPFFLLFVPFILTAWQYRYRWVLLFAIGSTVIDLVATGGVLAAYADAFAPTGLNLEVLGALLVARGVLFAFLGFFISKLVARQREDRDKLRGYAAAIEQISVGRERNRLARDLHDTLAHSMTGTAIQLEAATAIWEDNPDRAREFVEQALAGTRTGLTEARRAIENLRASQLEELGLAGALGALLEDVAAASGIPIKIAVPSTLPTMAPDLEHATYRIAEESITNAVRHAEPTEVTVSCSVANGAVTLIVADDGVGFDPDRYKDGHHGVVGMTERAELVGGELTILSDRDRGTRVQFTAPIDAVIDMADAGPPGG